MMRAIHSLHQDKKRVSIFGPQVLCESPREPLRIAARAGFEGLTQVREHTCLFWGGRGGGGYALHPRDSPSEQPVRSFLKHPKQEKGQWKGKIPLMNSPTGPTNK